jgi:hypothetical protein
MAAHICNSSTHKAEAGLGVHGQLGLHSETLSQTKQSKTNNPNRIPTVSAHREVK